jgi:hypothetical protein
VLQNRSSKARSLKAHQKEGFKACHNGSLKEFQNGSFKARQNKILLKTLLI